MSDNNTPHNKGKGKAVDRPSGRVPFVGFHGNPINIDFIPPPRVHKNHSGFHECSYIILSNLKNPKESSYEYHGTMDDLFLKEPDGRYGAISGKDFVTNVCSRLGVRDGPKARGAIAVYLSPETGWQPFSSVGEQLMKFRGVYKANKDNWFIGWYFKFPPGTATIGRQETLEDPLALIQDMLQNQHLDNEESTGDLTHDSGTTTAIGTTTTTPTPTKKRSSSGAQSDETVWPTFPYTLTPVPPKPKKTSGGLTSKVSKIPKFIAKSLAMPVPSQANAIPRPTTRPEPIERQTVLTELALELKRGGIEDLNGLLPVTRSPSMDQWRACCRLLPHLDPEQVAQDPKARSISFYHTKLTITPFQFWTAYQMLQGGGGFLAHGMGLGKTHSVLAAVTLKALIARSRGRCEEYWAIRQSGGGRRHLPRDAKANGPSSLACPSQKPGDVQCYCVPGGATRQLGEEVLVRGVSLIAVPGDLMSDWINAVVQAAFRPSTYHFVVVGGGDVPAYLKQDISLLRSKFKVTAVPSPALVASPGDPLVRDAFDLDWANWSTLETVGSYIFLISHHNTTFWDTFKFTPRELGMSTQTKARFQTGTVYGAPVGLHFIDEAHLPTVWSPSHLPMLMAMSHKHMIECDVWFVSGTPFPKNRFREVKAQVALLSDEAGEELGRLNERFKEVQYKRSPDKVERFIRHFKKVFNDNIVLRYIDSTMFFNQPITGIQDIRPQIISRRTPSSFLPLRVKIGAGSNISRKEIQKLVDRLQYQLPPHLPYAERLEKRKPASDTLYFISLFPAAATLINKHKLVVDDESVRNEIKQLADRKKVTDLALVREYWDKFSRDSPKLQYIREEMDRINGDRRVRPGRMVSTWKKVVLLAPNVSTAVFLYAWLANNPNLRVRNVSPVFYHRDLSRRDKQQVRDDFNLTDETSPRYRNYFVSSCLDAGTGLNLQIANYQILTSPLHRAADQDQAFRRTNRANQELPLVHKLLVLEDSPIDRINMAAQARRRIKTDPFNILQTLELWPVNEIPDESSQEDLAKAAGVRPRIASTIVSVEPFQAAASRHQDYVPDDIYGAD